MISAVFFDLDGTLADTAPDLAGALNQLLEEHKRPLLPFEIIRPAVSHGGNTLLRLAFPIAEDEPEFEGLRTRFLELYDSRRHRGTSFFPGMPEVLEALESEGLRWGVITNKPAWLTHPLLETLGVAERVACIVSGDSTDHRKPHPAPVLHACEITGSAPAASLYVGDAERDIAAGRAAGLHTLIARYGYIGGEEDPAQWQADGMIDHPQEIIDWIHAFRAGS